MLNPLSCLKLREGNTMLIPKKSHRIYDSDPAPTFNPHFKMRPVGPEAEMTPTREITCSREDQSLGFDPVNGIRLFK